MNCRVLVRVVSGETWTEPFESLDNAWRAYSSYTGPGTSASLVQLIDVAGGLATVIKEWRAPAATAEVRV